MAKYWGFYPGRLEERPWAIFCRSHLNSAWFSFIPIADCSLKCPLSTDIPNQYRIHLRRDIFSRNPPNSGHTFFYFARIPRLSEIILSLCTLQPRLSILRLDIYPWKIYTRRNVLPNHPCCGEIACLNQHLHRRIKSLNFEIFEGKHDKWYLACPKQGLKLKNSVFCRCKKPSSQNRFQSIFVDGKL